MKKIPVILNNRDLLTWPRAMVERIKKYYHAGEVIIIDNGSTYGPLLDWYNTNPCRIIRLDNVGHTAPWKCGIINDLDCEFYVVTDPDLGLELTPDDTLLHLADKLARNPEFGKVGLGLDWQSTPKDSPYFEHITRYEGGRWSSVHPVRDGIFVAVLIDTTFAIYKKETNHYFIGGGSVAAPYIARHLPWYYNNQQRRDDTEFMYYLSRANGSSTCKKFMEEWPCAK